MQVEELCFITENTYSREEILRQEQAVLGDLKFELTQPTVKTFVRRFVKVAEKALGAEEKRRAPVAESALRIPMKLCGTPAIGCATMLI